MPYFTKAMKNPKSKIISDKDNINSRDAKILWDNYRRDNKSGLIIPAEHVEHRENRCGFCGQPYAKNEKPRLWFEEPFHAKCIQKMLRGETNR